MPVITEYDGYVRYQDIVDGVTMREETDDITGITNKVIVDSKASGKKEALKPSIVLCDDKGTALQATQGGEAHYGLMVGTVLSVEDGAHVKAGDVLARLGTRIVKNTRYHGRPATSGRNLRSP